MSEEKDNKKAQEIPAAFSWIPAKEGVEEVYANFHHINWTLYDVRIRFGQIIPHPDAPPENAPWAIMEYAAVTVPWGQAKVLRDLLNESINRYEAANGEIAVPKLP